MNDGDLLDAITLVIEMLIANAEPLGAEFERVWDDNIELLYEP